MNEIFRKIKRRFWNPIQKDPLGIHSDFFNLIKRVSYDQDSIVVIDKEHISYKRFGPLSMELLLNFKSDLNVLFRLIDYFPDAFSISENNEIVFLKNGITLHIVDCDDLYVIEELLIEKLYNFNYPCKKPLIVVDIGMNVGLSCLYFALSKEVNVVYGFEPFEPTYRKAVKNFVLNKELAKKIKPYNIGLDNQECIIQVPIQNDRTLINSTSDFFIKERGVRADSYVEVKVESAATIISHIIKENADHALVLKLDCEGAEYTIFESLVEHDLIKNISVFLLEWHYKGFERIETILKTNDFSTIAMANKLRPEVGMLYAFRKSN